MSVLPALVIAAVLVVAAIAPGEPARHRRPLPVRLAVGQMVMAHMDGATPSRAFLRRVRAGRVGGVILLGDNVSPRLRATLRRLQHAARKGGNPPLLVAVDQEGGEVRRLGTPPRAAAREIGARPLRGIARTGWLTGRALRRLGVTVDLAPVADVPISPAAFIARQERAFATDPRRVGLRAGAFARGLRAGGVGATLKHFPGLGRLATSTDDAPGTVAASRAELRARDLAPFRRLVHAGRADLVMVGSARYPALGSRAPALASRRIVSGLLRGSLGYRGVVITDSLDAAALRSVPRAPLRAARAGADVLLFTGSEEGSAGRYRRLLRTARTHPADAARARRAAARIVALKHRLARRGSG